MKKNMLLNVTPALHWELIIEFENSFPDVKRRNWFQSLQYASPDIPRDCLCTRQQCTLSNDNNKLHSMAILTFESIREHWRAFESIRYHFYHCAPLAFATQHSSWRENTCYRNKQKNYDSIIWLTKLVKIDEWHVVMYMTDSQFMSINLHDEVQKSKLHGDHIKKRKCYSMLHLFCLALRNITAFAEDNPDAPD